MVTRSVTFVEMAVAAKMEQIEFVDETELLQHLECAVNCDPRDFRIDFLSVLKDFFRIKMSGGLLHHLQEHAALASETNSARTQILLQAAGRLVLVDPFARGDAMLGQMFRRVRHRFRPMRIIAESGAPKKIARRLAALEEFQYVAIHHEREETEQENQADLNEALLHGDAQIAANQPFDRQHQDVAAVQNRNGEKIEQT